METAVADTTTTPAPETSSPAPSSAPVTSTTPTTVSTPAVAERPSDWRSLSKLMQGLDAKDAATSETPPVVPPEAAATAQTQEPIKAGEVPSPPQGPIPFEKHKTILENSRREFDTYRQRFGWAERVPAEKLTEFAGIAQRMTADPIGFLNDFAKQLANHPTYGPQLRSSAGRTLASPTPQRPTADVDIVDDRGQPTGRKTYSDEQTAKLLEWERAAITGEFKQLIQPFQQERDQRLQREQVETFQREVNAGAESELTRVNEILEGKTELGPEVAKLMAQGVNHIDAALRVRKQFIVPTTAKAAEAAVLDTQLKKAAANTAGSTVAAVPRTRPTNAKELAAFLREQDAASA